MTAKASERKAHLKKIATQFVVEDVVATAEYYRDVFGFTILGYLPNRLSMQWSNAAEWRCISGKPTAGPRMFQIHSIAAQGFDAYIWVDDVRAIYDELKAAGSDIIEGTVKRIYESTEIVVRDCNGCILIFAD